MISIYHELLIRIGPFLKVDFSSVEISDSSERMTMTLDWPNYLLTHLILLVMWQLLVMWYVQLILPIYTVVTLYLFIVNLSIPIYRSINKCTDSFIVIDWLYIGLIHRQNCQNIYLSTYRQFIECKENVLSWPWEKNHQTSYLNKLILNDMVNFKHFSRRK